MSLLVSENQIRAYPGGTGSYKIGGNYAPCLLHLREAKQAGFDENLYLFDGLITEAGTMNVFIHWIDETGTLKTSTPPADTLILPGITRDCIIAMLKDANMPVFEEPISLKALVKSLTDGRVRCMFGTGTAATCVSVGQIGYHGQIYQVPTNNLAESLFERLLKIQTGKFAFNNWCHKIE